MSKLNEIQSQLRALDGGAYQKLVDAYLAREGYKDLIPVGSVLGKNKVKRGTPDTLIPDGGTYTFVEHTTTQEKELLVKLHKDLANCVNTKETGVPLDRIGEIVFTFPSDLKPADYHSLCEAARAHGVHVRAIGLQTLSFDLRHRYPDIALQFLGVSTDTRQILTPDGFVSRSVRDRLSTPLNTELRGRQEEVQAVLQALKTSKVVIITGNPGVGKSRLALECLRAFTSVPSEWTTHCIVNQGPDPYEDIRACFSSRGKYAVVVDDANRGRAFEYLIEQALDTHAAHDFRLIVTVRRYALDRVLHLAARLGAPPVIDISLLPDSTIEALVSAQFGIRSALRLHHIAKLARGNPRIAMMLGTVVEQQGSAESINDISQLYEQYFASIREDLASIDAANLMRAGWNFGFSRFHRSNRRRSNSRTIPRVRFGSRRVLARGASPREPGAR